jgi:hypothetical protein
VVGGGRERIHYLILIMREDGILGVLGGGPGREIKGHINYIMGETGEIHMI